MHGRGFEIGEIDGNLREIARFQGHAHRFYVAQTAGRKANGFGNFVGDGDIRGIQVDVVGDEEFARADDGGARGGMELGIADVGATVRIALQVFAQAFELPATNVFKIYAIGAGGRGFVEKYRDAVAFPDFVADSPGERDAIVERHSFDGNEGHHVGGSHARVSALMRSEIDERGSFGDTAQRRFGNGIGIAGEGHDAAVVVAVHFAVEDIHAGHAAHGGDDGVHFRGIAAFGKIGNALDQSGHG